MTFDSTTAILILIVWVLPGKEYPQVKRKLSNFNIIFTQMKQQTNNPQQLKHWPLFQKTHNFIYLLIQLLGYYAYLEQVCKLVRFFWVVRSTGWIPNLTTNHCIYACYLHFYKKFSEILKNILVKWLPVRFNTCWFQTMNNILTGTFKLTETPCMGTWRDRVHSQ